MITKNFRLNALANKYASALYNHITSTSGGDYFMVDADGLAVRVEIVNGVKGVRSLIDSYTLAAMKVSYSTCNLCVLRKFPLFTFTEL